MSILIVESDLQIGENLQALVEEHYQPVQVTTDSELARELVSKTPISLVIINWTMPGNAAAELCRWLRDDNVDHYVYILCIVARKNSKAQIDSLKAGADDVIGHPIESRELEVRLHSVHRMLAYHGLLLNKNHRLEATFEHLMRDFMEVTTELVDAGLVQQSLLPAAAKFADINALGLLKPATQLSGDSYDYFMLDEQYLAFYIADAVGHGSASAMVSYAVHHQIKPRTRGICSTHLHQSKSAEEAVINTVADLNEQFADGDTEANRWFTMIYGLIELSSGTVTLCQAGQPPALHCTDQGDQISELGGGGFPVGLIEGATYMTDQCVLKPGDKLLLCSDGAVECKSADNEEFGINNLKRVMQSCASLGLQETTDALTDKLVEWNGDTTFQDDLSILLFQKAA